MELKNKSIKWLEDAISSHAQMYETLESEIRRDPDKYRGNEDDMDAISALINEMSIELRRKKSATLTFSRAT